MLKGSVYFTRSPQLYKVPTTCVHYRLQFSARYLMLLKDSLCCLRLHLFNQKHRKNSNIVKYYYNFKKVFSIWIHFKMWFIPVMQSWIFCIITPVFSVTWSCRNHCNMLIYCSRNICIIIFYYYVEKSCATSYFCVNHILFQNRKFNLQYYLT